MFEIAKRFLSYFSTKEETKTLAILKNKLEESILLDRKEMNELVERKKHKTEIRKQKNIELSMMEEHLKQGFNMPFKF